MEDFRSKSCRDERMQMEKYNGGIPTSYGMHDLRCYSTSYASSANQAQMGKEEKFKEATSNFGSTKSWTFNDPELQRKKRVASYKVYTVEGKAKGSLRKSYSLRDDVISRNAKLNMIMADLAGFTGSWSESALRGGHFIISPASSVLCLEVPLLSFTWSTMAVW
ncbi:hypothetical protein NE237_027861 [Protea cynaroides]|uniref:Uncharacterized protein n=1 Tax=Protea cynaroides TaxID=273540 RepID=A0A9Q0GPB6_9MAGN|nr:hypothetical protein NE237_027861 [Protea cynaroides]